MILNQLILAISKLLFPTWMGLVFLINQAASMATTTENKAIQIKQVVQVHLGWWLEPTCLIMTHDIVYT